MKLIRNLAVCSLSLMAMSSCTMFNDNLSPCPDPVTELSFKYDYNMDMTDKFADEVHCLDLYLFDESGKIVTTHHEESNDAIKNKGFKISKNLLPGKYTAVVFGGTSCQDASFDKKFSENENLTVTDLKVDMKNAYYYVYDQSTAYNTGGLYSELTEAEHRNLELHNLYYGSAVFEVPEDEDVTVVPPINMQRDTNTILVNIINENGKALNRNDCHLILKDDNNTFDYKNDLQQTGIIYYRPYLKNDQDKLNALNAQFTISRLISANKPQLILKASDDIEADKVKPGENIENHALIVDVLAKIREYKEKQEETVKSMPEQEYLDRENKWLIEITIPDDASWLDAKVEVKNWDVIENPVYDFE